MQTTRDRALSVANHAGASLEAEWKTIRAELDEVLGPEAGEGRFEALRGWDRK